VYFRATIEGEHNHTKTNPQCRGKKRDQIKAIVKETKGSSRKVQAELLVDENDKAFNSLQTSSNEEPKQYAINNVPSCEVIRQIKHEIDKQFEKKYKESFQNSNNLDWYNKLDLIANSLNNQLTNGKTTGYVEDLSKTPSFRMSLIAKEQLKCINDTAEQNRILHFDATGGLVAIPSK
jgi:hypothetical protein